MRPRAVRWLFITAAVVALGAGLFWALARDEALGRDATALLNVELPDLAGHPRRLAEYRGKVLFINFWATWCGPCREEMPQFMRVQARDESKGVQFAGIAVDSADKVQQFATELKINYPLLIGGLGAMELSKQLGNNLMALPFTVVVDRQGRIAHTQLGPLKEPEIERLLKKLL